MKKRHALSTRLWHWINALCLVVLFMSGLNISNAHPRLYWGDRGFLPSEAWLSLPDFPGWITIPSYYSLAAARDWHVVFSLLFAFGLLAFMGIALINGHIRRDLLLRAAEWRPQSIWRDVKAHLRLDFEHGSGKYNVLQKLTYALVIFILLPAMIFTGMAMSPGMEAAWPWLSEMFGGRQSARSIHFLSAFALAGFLILHVVLVLLAGPITQLRGMLFGGRLDTSGGADAQA